MEKENLVIVESCELRKVCFTQLVPVLFDLTSQHACKGPVEQSRLTQTGSTQLTKMIRNNSTITWAMSLYIKWYLMWLWCIGPSSDHEKSWKFNGRTDSLDTPSMSSKKSNLTSLSESKRGCQSVFRTNVALKEVYPFDQNAIFLVVKIKYTVEK